MIKRTMNYSCQYQPETIPTLNNIYTFPESKDYRTRAYHDVKDIKSGYITYYPTKRQVKDVYSKPNFANSAKIEGSLYFNPMGSVMTDYKRTFVKDNLNQPNQFTFIRDTNEQREEIMALQKRKMNRSLYETKW